jgi:small subunit ribosomal protein S8e
MALWQSLSKRSKTGRRLRYGRGKRKFEIGREPHLTTIGQPKTKHVRTEGKNKKIRTLTTNIVYVVDQQTGKTTKTEINSVVENQANIHYIRRNIINKGAIVDTKLGKAKITSRPGQTGTLNAILLKESTA